MIHDFAQAVSRDSKFQNGFWYRFPFGVRRYFLRNTRRKFTRAMLPRGEAQKLPAGYYKSVMMDSYKVQSSQLPKFRDENTNSAR